MAVAFSGHIPIVWRGGVKAIGLDRAKWSYDRLLEKYGSFFVCASLLRE